MTWWEQTENGQAQIQKQPVICPVCKATLEYRFPEDRLWTYCKECKTDFYYKPLTDIPTRACPDSLKKDGKKCGCGRCSN